MTEPTLAILHGALGDTILAAPALELLARAGGPLTVWGPADERLRPLRAPRGPASAVRTFPREALSLWSPAPDAAARAALAPFGRVVAVCGPGPLASSVTSLGGRVVDAPRAGEVLGAPASGVLLERVRAVTGLQAEVDPTPRLRATDDDVARGRALAGTREYVVCHPGSGGAAKCWPADAYARALGRLPLPAVVVLGPVERERGLDPALFAPCRVVEDVGIDDLVALLAGSALFLGNDAGPTHLAAALGRRVVALFGPTDPRTWAPSGARVVRGDLTCITVEAVLDAVRDALASPGYPMDPRPGGALE